MSTQSHTANRPATSQHATSDYDTSEYATRQYPRTTGSRNWALAIGAAVAVAFVALALALWHTHSARPGHHRHVDLNVHPGAAQRAGRQPRRPGPAGHAARGPEPSRREPRRPERSRRQPRRPGPSRRQPRRPGHARGSGQPGQRHLRQLDEYPRLASASGHDHSPGITRRGCCLSGHGWPSPGGRLHRGRLAPLLDEAA